MPSYSYLQLYRLKLVLTDIIQKRSLTELIETQKGCVKSVLTRKDLSNGIEVLSEELHDCIDSFIYNRKWSTLNNIRDLSCGLEYLHKINSLMFKDPDTPEEYKAVETFNKEDAENWVSHMVTEMPDGSRVIGAHWTLEQTNTVAKQKGIEWTHITPYCFWVVMNMVYSDYNLVAHKYGVDKVDFYFDLAKSFLFDVDSVPPRTKVMEYYHHIVKPNIK